jgi:hypothetical protein
MMHQAAPEVEAASYECIAVVEAHAKQVQQALGVACKPEATIVLHDIVILLQQGDECVAVISVRT